MVRDYTLHSPDETVDQVIDEAPGLAPKMAPPWRRDIHLGCVEPIVGQRRAARVRECPVSDQPDMRSTWRFALVEEDLGRAVALDAARELVVFLKRPGGQAQFSAMLSMQRTDDRFGELHAWTAEHLAADLSVPALAERVSMSERSFVRVLGVSPQGYRERFVR